MKIESRDIFEQIGNLFYAIAADQRVQSLEVGELKSLISKDWLPPNRSESFVSDEAHFIITAMDFQSANRCSADDAFKEFSKFYLLHPDAFTREIKQRILDTAVEITRIFISDNPFKNPHLVALRDLLNLNRALA